MRDRFPFSDGQDLNALSSTGVVSGNIWDLEEDASVDQQLTGYLNVSFADSNDGATQGMYIEFRTSDNIDIDTSHEVLAIMFLTDAELTAAAGITFSVGFEKANLKKYAGVFYRPHTTSLASAETLVDAWFSEHPADNAVQNLQKRPT